VHSGQIQTLESEVTRVSAVQLFSVIVFKDSFFVLIIISTNCHQLYKVYLYFSTMFANIVSN